MTQRRLLNGDTAISFLLGLGGLYWMYASVRLGFWEGFAPRPGFLPFCYGALLFLLSAALFVKSLKGVSPSKSEPDARPWKPLLLIVLIVVTLIGLQTVGFVIAIFVALLVMFVAIEKLPLVRSITVAFAASVFFHFLLTVWLGVPLPVGPLGF